MDDPHVPPELIDTINTLIADAKRIAKHAPKWFLFERSYRRTHHDLELLEDRYTSYHNRAFQIAYSFLLQLLSHESEKLPAPEAMTYRPPARLAVLDLDVANHIAELYRDELRDDECEKQLIIEAEQAANLLGDACKPIPPEHRTKAMSKRQAAAYLGRANEDSGVRWLNECIDKGIVRCQPLTRQTYIFDCRDFPAAVQRFLAPSTAEKSNSR
jgi:hypothetical protein